MNKDVHFKKNGRRQRDLAHSTSLVCFFQEVEMETSFSKSVVALNQVGNNIILYYSDKIDP